MSSPSNPNTLVSPVAVVIAGPTGAGKNDLARYLVDKTGWQFLNRGQICRQLEFNNHLDGILSEIDPESYNEQVATERRRLLATGRPLVVVGQCSPDGSETRDDIDEVHHDRAVLSLNLEPEYVATLPTARDVTPDEIQRSYDEYRHFMDNDLDSRDIVIEVDRDHDHDRQGIALRGLAAYIDAYPKVEKTPDIE